MLADSDATPPAVRSDVADGVRTVVLDRPPVNALDVATLDRLTATFAAAARDPATSAVVVTGTGASFSAGIDTKAFVAADPAARTQLAASINRMLHALVGLRRPVVAAVNGHALGGGFVISLGCDARIASSGSARLGLTEVQAGVAYPAGPMMLLREKLPAHLVDRLVLRGDVLSPADAHALGLVDEIVDSPAVALVRAVELARDLATYPGFAAVKAQFRQQLVDRLAGTQASADPVLADWEGVESQVVV